MAYTFGGATADDIVAVGSHNIGGDGASSLFAGWWYPTTLTSTRGYCSAGNVYGMEVDSTTSQVRFRTDNTTDGQWTAPAGITIDKWWFIAFASSQINTGPAAEFRLWVGDAETPPAEVTVSVATAPVGNFTGNASRYAGNKGTGTLAFQGDVGWMSVISTNQNGINTPIGNATSGVITAVEATNILNRWVIPLWLGTPSTGFAGYGAHSNSFSVLHYPLTLLSPVYEWSHDQATASVRSPTINGATISARVPPRSPPHNWPHILPRVRRAA